MKSMSDSLLKVPTGDKIPHLHHTIGIAAQNFTACAFNLARRFVDMGCWCIEHA
jgi:hypothetical protein